MINTTQPGNSHAHSACACQVGVPRCRGNPARRPPARARPAHTHKQLQAQGRMHGTYVTGTQYSPCDRQREGHTKEHDGRGIPNHTNEIPSPDTRGTTSGYQERTTRLQGDRMRRTRRCSKSPPMHTRHIIHICRYIHRRM